MKRTLVLLAVICFSTLAMANGNSSEEEFPKWLQGLGVAAGHYSGVGMSYKLIHNGTYGVQLTAGYYSDDEYRWAMPGIELQYHLSRHKNTSFYVSTGISYEYTREEYYYWCEWDGGDWICQPSLQTTEIWTAGAGFGIEAIVLDRISLTAETIFYYRDNDRASIMVQGAIHYYFNIDRKNKSEAKSQSQIYSFRGRNPSAINPTDADVFK